MVWHVVGTSTLLALLKWRRIVEVMREQVGLQSSRALGYAFASCYALVAVPLAMNLFDGAPMPRFNDIFLVGIALTAYFFRWEPAVYLLAVSTLASAWILAPYGSLRVEGLAEWYRLLSFTAVSLFIILLLTRVKLRRGEADGPLRLPVANGD